MKFFCIIILNYEYKAKAFLNLRKALKQGEKSPKRFSPLKLCFGLARFARRTAVRPTRISTIDFPLQFL